MTRGANFENLEAVVKSPRLRADTTRENIVAALRTIEREIDEHGWYLQNDGKVNLTEVARRAKVSAVTLRNRHHHGTREIVQDWLAQLKQRGPTTKPKARRAAQEKIAWYEDALRKVNAEALKWRVELAALKLENKNLRQQIATMKSGSGTNVVGINSKDVIND